MILLLEQLQSISDKINNLWFQAEQLDQDRQLLLEKLEGSIDESMLRSIIPNDVKIGQIVFGRGDDGWFVREIQEVMNPKSDFKAWVSDDGCRYGLHNSFVLK